MCSHIHKCAERERKHYYYYYAPYVRIAHVCQRVCSHHFKTSVAATGDDQPQQKQQQQMISHWYHFAKSTQVNRAGCLWIPVLTKFHMQCKVKLFLTVIFCWLLLLSLHCCWCCCWCCFLWLHKHSEMTSQMINGALLQPGQPTDWLPTSTTNNKLDGKERKTVFGWRALLAEPVSAYDGYSVYLGRHTTATATDEQRKLIVPQIVHSLISICLSLSRADSTRRLFISW